MSDRFESELRSGFQALRRLDVERAPAFEDVLGDAAETRWAPLPSGRRRWHLVALPAALAAAGLAAVVLRPTQEEHFEAVLAESVEQLGYGWVAPSDFLMSYPGREFYSRIPSIGPDPAPNPRTYSEEDNR